MTDTALIDQIKELNDRMEALQENYDFLYCQQLAHEARLADVELALRSMLAGVDLARR